MNTFLWQRIVFSQMRSITNLLVEILTHISTYEEQLEKLSYDDTTQRANERQIEVLSARIKELTWVAKSLIDFL